jgi:hypothetical protein
MKSGILLRVSIRSALAWCVFSITGFIFVRPIVSTLIPIMETMIDHMQSDYLARLALVDVQGNPEITMSCMATRRLFLPGPGGHLNIPHPWPGQNPPPGSGGTVDDYAG